MSEKIISKTYLCPIVGAGTAVDPRRPKVADLDLKCSWFMHELNSGFCLVTVVAMTQDHSKIVADADFELVMVQDAVVSSAPRFEQLKVTYPSLEEKLGTTRKCSVKFMEVTEK